VIEYGDALRPILEAKIGPIDPDQSITVARVENGRNVCLAAFTGWSKGDVELMGASEPGGITRKFIRELAAYAFDVLKVNRVTAKARMSNVACHKVLGRLGFKCEGVLRKADNGEDVLVFGLLKEELKHVK
jgi:hypothetical protein